MVEHAFFCLNTSPAPMPPLLPAPVARGPGARVPGCLGSSRPRHSHAGNCDGPGSAGSRSCGRCRTCGRRRWHDGDWMLERSLIPVAPGLVPGVARPRTRFKKARSSPTRHPHPERMRRTLREALVAEAGIRMRLGSVGEGLNALGHRNGHAPSARSMRFRCLPGCRPPADASFASPGLPVWFFSKRGTRAFGATPRGTASAPVTQRPDGPWMTFWWIDVLMNGYRMGPGHPSNTSGHRVGHGFQVHMRFVTAMRHAHRDRHWNGASHGQPADDHPADDRP